MSRLKKAARIALYAAAGTVALTGLGLAGGYLWLRGSLPAYSGTLSAPGLKARIEIVRDAQAVPHIFASNREDAFYGLGWVHAQDRLWQLEMTRRAGQARIAEAVGEDGLATDQLVAALDLDRVARETDARNDPATRAAIRAYVAGINAAIDARSGPLPPEFLLLGLVPGHWSEADVNRLGGLAALGFGDWREELLRARIATRIDCARLRDLYARADEPGPVTYPGAAAQDAKPADSCGAVALRGKAASAIPDLPFGRASPASNSWAIAGSRTAGGSPMLANDPHGPLGAPADYYPARLVWPGSEIVGASRPGSPAIASGRNRDIAWGVTDMMADQADLFVERLDPADANRYLTPDGPRPFATRRVTIPVKGAAARQVTLRYTRHGIVISDIDADAAQLLKEQIGGGHVIALAGLDFPGGNPLVKAFLGMAEARDWNGFQAAARDFGLQHNFAFAARDGTIGMLSAGHLPVRGGDGFLPAPGWDARFDWKGFLEPAQWPFVRDPAAGYAANGNNRLVSGQGGAIDSAAFEPGWRAARITARLAAMPRANLESVKRLQTDIVSAEVAALRPVLEASRPATPGGQQARAMLLKWDGAMAPDRPEPLIWAAWQRAMGLRLIGPALGPLAQSWLAENRPRFKRLLRPGSPWCGDCRALAAQALDEAVDGLNKQIGGTMESWRWGRLHQARFDHEIFAHVPLIAGLVAIRVPAGGDAVTVNAGQGALWSDDPWSDVYGPRYRQIIDLGAPEKSLFMIAPGVSGNPLSPWFGHLAGRWSQGGYFTLTGDAATLRAEGVGNMIIDPRR
ncbi:penicillin acylase family protein [Sphingomonas canadensis]|uniref:Penicillin acylase family protein n=1 Tax=Sphingomonas canadensis TaxID=1219257 RepID=A0ABW3H1S2_9SPHN|nr:penicillin acylase family protein [Sphingomonas canadensis]MCW3834689.1 penicillin acylase family protein [Sphingomonas canadensis]